MDKALTAVMAGILALGMIVVVAGVAQAMTPTPQYTCPICGDPFMTYEDLYNHFTTEHPSEPIDIIWES